MQEGLAVKKFERIDYYSHERTAAEHLAAVTLKLGKVAMDFSRVERVPRYADGERESDVGHSYMLALVAPELAAALELNLDRGLLSQYAIVHDLIELKTGDVATFNISDEALMQKAKSEQEALQSLLDELPPYTAQLLLRYEHQLEPEARFIKLVDKLLPLAVDILGEGERVMREDYSVETLAQLQANHETLNRRLQSKFGDEFDDLQLAHRILAELFETKFALSPAGN